ncbi:MAG: PAS domain-containing protein [Clostridiales Family XIII bacterium]|nr:PAS domain-containing protein [Clostridiales Family XIII bacterium]
MKKRILIFSCLLAVLSVLLTAALFQLAAFNNYFAEAKQETISETNLIKAAVETVGESYLDSIINVNPELRISLMDRNGDVLYDSDISYESLGSHASRPEFIGALTAGFGESTRLSDTFGEQTYYYAVLLEDGNVLRTARTVDSVFASFFRLILLTVLIAVAVIIAAITIGARVTNSIVDPINRLDLDHIENNAVYEELSPLLRRMKHQNDIISGQMAEIKQKQQEFSAITDNMREGLLVLDRDAYILSCNKSALHLLHLQIEFPLRLNVLALNRSKEFLSAIETVLDGAPTESMLHINGRYIQLIANPVWDAGGAILMLLDVTEREDREKLRREFTANVSHELKTPLTSISGYAEIISTGLAKKEDVPRFAYNIFTESQRLITLIGDIMLLSKLDEYEKVNPPAREDVDLFALTQEILPRFYDSAAKKDVSLSLEGDSAVIYAVRQAIDEMIFNLLDNAIKYNCIGGSAAVSITKADGAAILSVSDTGVGIPLCEQDRVFERFYRVEKSRSNSVEGTGLGLSIVKHAVLLHHGGVTIQSDGSSGTVISVSLPLAAG